MLKKYFKRNFYIKKIEPFINQNLVKVLVGQRRVGKSYILLQLIDEFKVKKISAKRILYINKEEYEFNDIKDDGDLITFVKNYFKGVKAKKYLFIDEVQEIKDFHKAIRSLNTEQDYDIYITGSNADMLSSDIANSLGGRYISFEISGLSYQEFLKFSKLEANQDNLLKYIRYGSLPYLLHLSDEEELKYSYLKSIYNSIVLRDIVKKHDLRNVDFLEKLIYFLADNIASSFSAKSICDYLKAEGIKISPQIILNYLKYLDDSFFIHQVRRFDLEGKKIFQSNEKYFFNDLGLRHSLIGYKPNQLNKILENLIYSELRRRDYKIFAGHIESGREVDFVASKGQDTLYIQASLKISDPKTYQREIQNLLDLKDNYPKYIITMNKLEQGDDRGVKIIYLEDFLLKT